MALFYLDASALVKRYVSEKGSTFVTQTTDPLGPNESLLASIGCVELVAALYRRVSTGSLMLANARLAEQAFRADLSRFLQPIDLNPSILGRAMGYVARSALALTAFATRRANVASARKPGRLSARRPLASAGARARRKLHSLCRRSGVFRRPASGMGRQAGSGAGRHHRCRGGL